MKDGKKNKEIKARCCHALEINEDNRHQSQPRKTQNLPKALQLFH